MSACILIGLLSLKIVLSEYDEMLQGFFKKIIIQMNLSSLSLQ